MKICITALLIISLLPCLIGQQNVGIGILSPAAKLHVKGSADTSQLIIDAHSMQANTHPLIRLRRSNGNDLMWIHTDSPTNAFIGLNAGRVNNSISGLYNLFFGMDAGYSNTTGSYNIAISPYSLYSNSTGYNNTAIGYQSLHGNTTGHDNVALGQNALYSNQIGSNNIAIGNYTLASNHAGFNATAVGAHAMQFSNSTTTFFTNY